MAYTTLQSVRNKHGVYYVPVCMYQTWRTLPSSLYVPNNAYMAIQFVRTKHHAYVLLATDNVIKSLYALQLHLVVSCSNRCKLMPNRNQHRPPDSPLERRFLRNDSYVRRVNNVTADSVNGAGRDVAVADEKRRCMSQSG
jgi:hypothetical protein